MSRIIESCLSEISKAKQIEKQYLKKSFSLCTRWQSHKVCSPVCPSATSFNPATRFPLHSSILVSPCIPPFRLFLLYTSFVRFTIPISYGRRPDAQGDTFARMCRRKNDTHCGCNIAEGTSVLLVQEYYIP